MYQEDSVISRGSNSILATHHVLRKTYMLLGLTLLFSAATAWYGMVSHAAPMNIFLFFIGTYGLMFLTQALRHSVWGIAATFAFTGFMGYTIGPILSYYVTAFSNGPALVATALGATGVIFFALSAYVIATGKDFTFMGGFLMVAILVVFLASIAGVVFGMQTISLFASAGFALICSGLILYQTSMIVQGGERNFIMATIALYVSIYNLFLSLLQILGALSGQRD